MNKHHGRDTLEIPNAMKDIAEAGFEQARKAFEAFIDAAQKTASTFEDQGSAAQASAKELGGKAVAFVESSIRASLDHADRLVQAKDVAEILRLQGEYIQSQMRALAEQAGEMGQAVTRATMDAAKPK